MLAVDQIRKDDDLDFELDNYYDKDLDNDLYNDLEWLINTSVGQQKVGNQIPFWLRHNVQYGDAGGISDNSKIKRDYLDDNLDFDRWSRAG